MIKDKVNSSPKADNGVKYGFYTHHISYLEGKLLTLLEASIQDLEQRKALKDIARQTIWNWAIENNVDR